MNSRRQVIGNSDLSGNTATDTFLWQHGTMSDLGTLPGDVDNFAGGINDAGQVVGESCDASENCRGYLWQNGSMYDLYTLIPPSSATRCAVWRRHQRQLGQIVGAAVNAQGVEQAIRVSPYGSGNALRKSVSGPKVHAARERPDAPREVRSRFGDLRTRSAVPR